MFLRWCSLALRSSCFRNPHVSIRAFRSSRTARKDAAGSALDLDAWKSVMRSQALQEESKSRSALEDNRELVEMWHQAGKFVPKNITDEQLEELSRLTARSAKKKFLKFLAIKETHKINKKEKQERKKSEREADMTCQQEGQENVTEEELKNSFLLKFWSSSADRVQSWRAAQAMCFGQPLVFDMSYEQHMTRREMENTVAQLMESEGWNRRATDPFHLHFCGLQPEGAYLRELRRRYGANTWDRLLITATEKTHLEVFPQRDLVYLTADSKNVLQVFDHSKVYIIGAMVDRSIQSGASLANAKRLQLTTARLPLDECLDWECGAKNLTLDQMIRILMTLKDTGSWKKALEFVPKRKHAGFTGVAKSRFEQRDSARSRFGRSDSAESRFGRNNSAESRFGRSDSAAESRFGRSDSAESRFSRSDSAAESRFGRSDSAESRFTRSDSAESRFGRSNSAESRFGRNNSAESRFTRSDSAAESRFGRSDSAESRFTRSDSAESRFGRNNSAESRFGRNNSAESRFGRSDSAAESRFGRSDSAESRFGRNNSAESRFGRSDSAAESRFGRSDSAESRFTRSDSAESRFPARVQSKTDGHKKQAERGKHWEDGD